MISAPSSPSNLSSVTLVGSTESGSGSSSDPSPQDVGSFSCGMSKEADTPTTTDDNIAGITLCEPVFSEIKFFNYLHEVTLYCNSLFLIDKIKFYRHRISNY